MTQVKTADALAADSAGFKSLLRVAGAPDWVPHIESYMTKAKEEQSIGFLYRLAGELALAVAIAVGVVAEMVALAGYFYLPAGTLSQFYLAGTALFSCVLLVFLWIRYGQGPYDKWQTNPVYKYRNNRHGYMWGTHHRSSIYAEVPPFAQALIDRILTLAPTTLFQVSFLGEDPVLWAYPKDKWEERVPIEIWEGHGRKATRILPPP